MLRLREQRAETVQRIMQKVVDRKASETANRSVDPTGARGNLIDTVG